MLTELDKIIASFEIFSSKFNNNFNLAKDELLAFYKTLYMTIDMMSVDKYNEFCKLPIRANMTSAKDAIYMIELAMPISQAFKKNYSYKEDESGDSFYQSKLMVYNTCTKNIKMLNSFKY